MTNKRKTRRFKNFQNNVQNEFASYMGSSRNVRKMNAWIRAYLSFQPMRKEVNRIDEYCKNQFLKYVDSNPYLCEMLL